MARIKIEVAALSFNAPSRMGLKLRIRVGDQSLITSERDACDWLRGGISIPVSSFTCNSAELPGYVRILLTYMQFGALCV